MDIVDIRTQNLTETELQVIQAAANGMTLEKTAEHLGLTSIVVRLHRYRAVWKTDAKDICALVTNSLYEGWITVPDGMIFMPAEDESSVAGHALVSSEFDDARFVCPLNGRQLEVTRALATGLPIAEIAKILNISGVTVRKHIQRARDAAKSPTKIDLVATAIAEGWIAPPPKRSMGTGVAGEAAEESIQIRYIALGSAA